MEEANLCIAGIKFVLEKQVVKLIGFSWLMHVRIAGFREHLVTIFGVELNVMLMN
jgi:hypothetical protein